jgi:HlyD family secretion protein
MAAFPTGPSLPEPIRDVAPALGLSNSKNRTRSPDNADNCPRPTDACPGGIERASRKHAAKAAFPLIPGGAGVGTAIALSRAGMIPSTSAMDKPVAKARGLSPRVLVAAGLAAAGLVALVLAVPALRRWSRADRAVDASTLRLADVQRGDLERDVSAQSRIVAALHPTLFSPAQGTVTVAVKAGTQVKKGQVLARVESPELMSRLVQERSTLLSIQSDYERQRIAARQASLRSKQGVDILRVRLAAARRALERARQTFDQGLLNKVDYEKAQDDVEVASLELKNAEDSSGLERETLEFEVKNRAQLVARQRSVSTELQRQVEGLTIAAPFDGMVATVNVQDRDAVVRDAPILTVVDLSAFEVEFDLPENYATDVTPGTPAEVLFEGKTYPGRVTAISPEIKDSQVKGTVVFEGKPPTGLRQSQRVTTRIVMEKKTGVVKVPRGPFLESGAGRHAYVVDGGVAVRREIAVGAVSVSEVEIVRGLSPGERIVVSDTSVFDGARTVLIRN